MSELIYIDTNVYMDYIENRVDRLRPLGEFAFQLLKKAVSCRFVILFSALVLEELLYNSCAKETERFLAELGALGKIVRVDILPIDRERARGISSERKTPLNDTLHAVIAQRMHAVYFVTRNTKDFIDLQDLITLSFPENL